MSVPDHQLDPPDSYVTVEEIEAAMQDDPPNACGEEPRYMIGIDPGRGDMSVSVYHPAQEHPFHVGDQIHINGVEGMILRVSNQQSHITYTVRQQELVYTPLTVNNGQSFSFPINEPHHDLTAQIMNIFKTPFPRESQSMGWWTKNPTYNLVIPSSHEKRTRYYLDKYPWWKLWKINKKLEEEKLRPTIDHEESQIMIGKSKAVAAYIQHNTNFKHFINELVGEPLL